MYVALFNRADIANRQQKWKLLDKHILGPMASMIDNSLLSHVIYEWTDPLTFSSISKDIWDKLKDSLLHYQFCSCLLSFQYKSHSNTLKTDINDTMSFFDQTTQIELDLPHIIYVL